MSSFVVTAGLGSTISCLTDRSSSTFTVPTLLQMAGAGPSAGLARGLSDFSTVDAELAPFTTTWVAIAMEASVAMSLTMGLTSMSDLGVFMADEEGS